MEKTFLSRLKFAMEKENITQTELAKKTNIRQSSISDWLNGRYIPKVDKIEIISRALNVNPAYLMGWEDYPNYDLSFKFVQKKDEIIKDLNPEIKEIINNIKNSFNGYDISPTDEEIIKIYLLLEEEHKKVIKNYIFSVVNIFTEEQQKDYIDKEVDAFRKGLENSLKENVK